ncbi:hypothetical protein Xant_22555 [Xanthomonas cissicola]|uniref:Uncharacterized protein n=1 Tax=Xanthomonas cissicola TaxID=86186 RepID=A0ABX3LZF8_9XANT|nr:hypothetical protein Xant_22555 [Xanthomonas cissicola]
MAKFQRFKRHSSERRDIPHSQASLFRPSLAKESSRHRNNEVLNRRRQHILTTIEPYLALLDPRKAEEVKTDVARSLFSDAIAAPAEKSEDTSNILAQLSNLVTTIIKQKR